MPGWEGETVSIDTETWNRRGWWGSGVRHRDIGDWGMADCSPGPLLHDCSLLEGKCLGDSTGVLEQAILLSYHLNELDMNQRCNLGISHPR